MRKRTIDKFVENTSTRTLQDFILKHYDLLIEPEYLIYWNTISENEAITCEYVNKYIHFPWSWSNLSKNPNLTYNFVNQHFNKPWDIHKIITNHNLDMELITMLILKESFLPHIYWTLTLSMHPKLTPEFVESNSSWNWQWVTLSNNKNFCKKCIEQGKFIENIIRFTIWGGIYVNHSVLYYSDFQEELVKNQKITLSMVKKNPIEYWNLKTIAEQIDVSEIILDPELFSGVWYAVSRNNNLTVDFISKYIDKNWDWNLLSSNECITQDLVSQNIYKPWNWCNLSRLKNIYPEFILDSFRNKGILIKSQQVNKWCTNNSNNEVCWHCLTYNPNIDIQFITKYFVGNIVWQDQIHATIRWDLLASNESVDPEYIFSKIGFECIGFICKNTYKRLDRINTKKLISYWSNFPDDIIDIIVKFI